VYTRVGVVTYLAIFANYPVNVIDTVSVTVKNCWFDFPKTVFFKLDVHGSVHRNINLIERTNMMQLCSRIYYSNVS